MKFLQPLHGLTAMTLTVSSGFVTVPEYELTLGFTAQLIEENRNET